MQVTDGFDILTNFGLLYILMYLFNIPGLWLDNAVIFKVSIPRSK